MLVPNGLDHQALDVRLLSSVPSPVADALLAKGCGRAADVLAQPQVLQEVLAQYRVAQPERRAGEMLRAVGREAAPTWRHATSALELLQQGKAAKAPVALPCTALNQLLGSALHTGLLEVCGLPGSGKTQFCLPGP